jgi:hypothetical protein
MSTVPRGTLLTNEDMFHAERIAAESGEWWDAINRANPDTSNP